MQVRTLARTLPELVRQALRMPERLRPERLRQEQRQSAERMRGPLPELLLEEARIGSTFVMYGSARIPSPEKADAVLAASVFHFGEYKVADVKAFLKTKGIEVRL